MRRLLLIGGLALALSGCAAYGPDYGSGYGYGSAYPYASGYGGGYGYAYPSYGYSAPSYGYSAPYYGYGAPYYNPGPNVSFGFFGGGGGDRDRHWDGGHGGDWRRSGDGGRDFQHNDFRGNPQARAVPAPAPRAFTPAPPRPQGGGMNVGKNYGGPEGGPSR